MIPRDLPVVLNLQHSPAPSAALADGDAPRYAQTRVVQYSNNATLHLSAVDRKRAEHGFIRWRCI